MFKLLVIDVYYSARIVSAYRRFNGDHLFLLLGTDGELQDASSTITEGKEEEAQLVRTCLQSKMKGTSVTIL